MPNRDEHYRIAAMTGPSFTFLKAASQGRQVSATEALGSFVSSAITSRLPDALEPATHPNHRSTFHSVAFLGVLALLALPKVEAASLEHLRLAEECRKKAASSFWPQQREEWLRQARWHELCAGFWGGLIPGYASHLLADSRTPKGLPFI
jgi:hypothetical protein